MRNFSVKIAPPTHTFEVEAETISEAIEKAEDLYLQKTEGSQYFEAKELISA